LLMLLFSTRTTQFCLLFPFC